jgi:hypothetical protein
LRPIWIITNYDLLNPDVAYEVIGISVRQVAECMGRAKPTTTEHIYTHVYKAADHADEMAALGAMEAGPVHAENVVPLWG